MAIERPVKRGNVQTFDDSYNKGFKNIWASEVDDEFDILYDAWNFGVINIADGSVTEFKLVDGSITTSKLRDGAVTNAKVTDVDWTKITNVPANVGGGGWTDTGTVLIPSKGATYPVNCGNLTSMSQIQADALTDGSNWGTFIAYSHSDSIAANVILARSKSFATVVNIGDALGNYAFNGLNVGPGSYAIGATMTAYAAQAFTPTAVGTRLAFSVVPIGSLTVTERLSINPDGRLRVTVDPINALDLATKQYVDARAAGVYLLAGGVAGVPTASQSVGFYVGALAFTLPISLTGSQAVAKVAATAQTDFGVLVNGVNKGSLRWAAGNTVASFIFTVGVSIAAGDRVEITAPVTPDTTLADIAWTLKGAI